jgi:hypothetical protein
MQYSLIKNFASPSKVWNNPATAVRAAAKEVVKMPVMRWRMLKSAVWMSARMVVSAAVMVLRIEVTRLEIEVAIDGISAVQEFW